MLEVLVLPSISELGEAWEASGNDMPEDAAGLSQEFPCWNPQLEPEVSRDAEGPTGRLIALVVITTSGWFEAASIVA